MSRLMLRACGYVLAVSLVLGSLPALAAASQPVLYSIGASAPRVLAQGAQKSWPIKISEETAMDAVFQGGMWLPTPSGGRIYAKYDRNIIHPNGIWTWIGSIDTVHGAQQVVLTFGKDGVFGLIPQASGYPLRIVTSQGETRVVETSAQAMARSVQALRLHARPDYAIPPRLASRGGQNTLAMRAAADAAVKQAAASSGPVTIDVMVAYTKGFAGMLGNERVAKIRIQNLVDITNEAYRTSGVNQQIRLVHTVEVSYSDNTSNQTALDEITGIDENSNPVSIPASLANIASLRVQYGADLVAMIRSYDRSTQSDCGVGWLIGGDQTEITRDSNVYGYSVVSDGSSEGYYCLDTTFAHELGHNMGDAHDRANADHSGAYSYSYGYLGNGTYGFSTIMAYGTDTDTPLAVFSNPNISICQNKPCGVADSASNSADNVHSMNNTASVIAEFEPTTVGTAEPRLNYIRNDINGDGKSDLLWRYSSSTGWAFGYWLLEDATVTKTWSLPTSSAYRVAATGDFNGDGYLDIAWTSARRDIKIWFGNGNSFSGSNYVASYSAGWDLVGAGDIDGDGKTDLLFRYESGTRGKFGYWIMNGAKLVRTWSTPTSTTYRVGTTGDFNGDGKLDVAWTSNKGDVKLWLGNGKSFSSSKYAGSYAAGWTMAGAGDVDGDGRSDLLFVYRSGSTARLGYWIQNGATRIRTWSSAFDAAYHIASTGDFNGDGHLDIAWTSAGSDIQLWTGDGTDFSGNTFVRSYGPGWEPISDTL